MCRFAHLELVYIEVWIGEPVNLWVASPPDWRTT